MERKERAIKVAVNERRPRSRSQAEAPPLFPVADRRAGSHTPLKEEPLIPSVGCLSVCRMRVTSRKSRSGIAPSTRTEMESFTTFYKVRPTPNSVSPSLPPSLPFGIRVSL